MAAALAAALLVGGCAAVGPDYRRPETQAPPAWPAPPGMQSGDVASRPVQRSFDGRLWWGVFQDPLLNQLVDEAVQQNLDLQTAAWRIAEARAQRDVAAGAALPSAAATGLGGRTRMSENGLTSALGGGGSGSSGDGSGGGSGGGSGNGGAASGQSTAPALVSNLFQAGFDATWELDLWGKTRRSVEAAEAGTESAIDARAQAAVSLTAEVARTYLTLRGLQREQAVSDADVAAQVRLLALVDASARAGLVPRSDVAEQAAQLATVRAQQPTLLQRIDQATNRLALLLAMPPGALSQRLAQGQVQGQAQGQAQGPAQPLATGLAQPLAQAPTAPAVDAALPPEVPVGLPGDLLRRRPDVARAEADLRAATARVGVADAQRYPSIQFGATAGLQATHLSDLADWASRFFIAGAQLSMPLFQGGRLRAQVQVADARLQQAALAYRQAVLSAYHEANDAVVAYVQEQQQTAALQRQLAEASRSRDLALDRYRQGLSPFIEVLTAERSVYQAQRSVLQSSVAVRTDLVALYKALGGDWAGAEARTGAGAGAASAVR